MKHPFFESVPIPILIAIAIFLARPGWESALITLICVAFVSFKIHVESKNLDEKQKFRDELKQLKNQIEALQISRSIGR